VADGDRAEWTRGVRKKKKRKMGRVFGRRREKGKEGKREDRSTGQYHVWVVNRGGEGTSNEKGPSLEPGERKEGKRVGGGSRVRFFLPTLLARWGRRKGEGKRGTSGIALDNKGQRVENIWRKEKGGAQPQPLSFRPRRRGGRKGEGKKGKETLHLLTPRCDSSTRGPRSGGEKRGQGRQYLIPSTSRTGLKKKRRGEGVAEVRQSPHLLFRRDDREFKRIGLS